MMNLRKVYEYYSNEDVQNFLLNFGKDREVVGVFRNGNFSQRPNVILYQNDITAMVKTGVVEFHGSLERWSQPMSLRQDNYNQLRTGWDLIFDIDCKLFEHGKIASEAFIWGLRKHDIKGVSIKFSVDYDEQVFIREGNRCKTVKIGELVDNLIANSPRSETTNKDNVDKAFVKNLDIASLNPENLKIEFKPISEVLKHPLSEPLSELSLKGGRKVKVTDSHSVFILKNGEIGPAMVSELKEGDHVLLAKKMPSSGETIKEINVIEKLAELEDKITKDIIVEGLPSSFKKGAKKDFTSIFDLKKSDKIKKTCEIPKLSIRYRGSRNTFPSRIRVDKNLMRLMGYYAAEGCYRYEKSPSYLIFSFGSHEKEFIEDVKKCIKNVLGAGYHKNQPAKSSYQIFVSSPKLASIMFDHVLKCGKDAFSKKIPEIVFNSPPEFQIDFLKAYFNGDGYLRRSELSCKTSSKKLASDLVYLFLQLGTFPKVYESIPAKSTKKCYHLMIGNYRELEKIKNILPGKAKNSSQSLTYPPIALPTDHSGLKFLHAISNASDKRNFRSRIIQKKYINPEYALKAVTYLKENEREPTTIKIAKKIMEGETSVPELSDSLNLTRKVVYNSISKLEMGNLIEKIRQPQAFGGGGRPALWRAKNENGVYALLENYRKTMNFLSEGSDFLTKLAQSDLAFAPIVRIRKIKPTKKFVYDISVEGNESFVGGFGGVLLHNTGGTGFHIGIPWESIPKTIDYRPSAGLYPELARKIVLYLKDFVYERLEKALFKKFSAEDISHQVNKPLGRILTDEGMNVYEVVDVDPILMSPRHLFRLPYSLNSKTFLVSLPIKPANLEDFERMLARPDDIKVETGFLDESEADEAELLIAEAIDWNVRMKKKLKERMESRIEITAPVPPERFPPCIKNILNGLSDGRKRSVFILLNFLRSSKWNWDDIEKYMIAWNGKNKPPLREAYIRSQVRWHRARNKDALPPNCLNEGWYKSFGVCNPDEKCRTIKNPVNYAIRKERKEPIKEKGKRK